MGNDSTDDEQCTRRTFLRRGVAGSALGVGFGQLDHRTEQIAQQDDELIPRVRIAVPRLDILANSYLRKLVVFVGDSERAVPPDLARRCFGKDAPRRLNRHDVVVADWEGVTRLTAENAQEALQYAVPARAFLRPDAEVSVSAPYVIVDGYTCNGEYLNVNAHKLPEAVRDDVGQVVGR